MPKQITAKDEEGNLLEIIVPDDVVGKDGDIVKQDVFEAAYNHAKGLQKPAIKTPVEQGNNNIDALEQRRNNPNQGNSVMIPPSSPYGVGATNLGNPDPFQVVKDGADTVEHLANNRKVDAANSAISLAGKVGTVAGAGELAGAPSVAKFISTALGLGAGAATDSGVQSLAQNKGLPENQQQLLGSLASIPAAGLAGAVSTSPSIGNFFKGMYNNMSDTPITMKAGLFGGGGSLGGGLIAHHYGVNPYFGAGVGALAGGLAREAPAMVVGGIKGFRDNPFINPKIWEPNLPTVSRPEPAWRGLPAQENVPYSNPQIFQPETPASRPINPEREAARAQFLESLKPKDRSGLEQAKANVQANLAPAPQQPPTEFSALQPLLEKVLGTESKFKNVGVREPPVVQPPNIRMDPAWKGLETKENTPYANPTITNTAETPITRSINPAREVARLKYLESIKPKTSDRSEPAWKGLPADTPKKINAEAIKPTELSWNSPARQAAREAAAKARETEAKNPPKPVEKKIEPKAEPKDTGKKVAPKKEEAPIDRSDTRSYVKKLARDKDWTAKELMDKIYDEFSVRNMSELKDHELSKLKDIVENDKPPIPKKGGFKKP